MLFDRLMTSDVNKFVERSIIQRRQHKTISDLVAVDFRHKAKLRYKCQSRLNCLVGARERNTEGVTEEGEPEGKDGENGEVRREAGGGRNWWMNG